MNSSFSFKTVDARSEGIYSDKGSKFTGYLFPVTTEEAFRSELKKLRSEHTGARHFCWAMRIGTTGVVERSNDDGEPSGTAGKPILNQLISRELTGCGLIVVRYFGGTLLGTTGLIKAYKTAAAEAISNSTIIEKDITENVILAIPYARYNAFLAIFKKHSLHFQQGDTSESEIMITITLPTRIKAIVVPELESLNR